MSLPQKDPRETATQNSKFQGDRDAGKTKKVIREHTASATTMKVRVTFANGEYEVVGSQSEGHRPAGNQSQGHRPRGRAGGSRQRRRRKSATKGKRPASPGIYGPKDFSAWGLLQDPRYVRPDAWANEYPISPPLLQHCVLVVAAPHVDNTQAVASRVLEDEELLSISPVGVLCKPNKEELLWWVRLTDCEYDWFPQVDATAQALAIKQIELLNKPTKRDGIQISGRASKVGHRMPMGGYSGVGFGNSNVTLEPANVARVAQNQLAIYELFPRGLSALLSSNRSMGLLASDPDASFGQSPLCAISGLAHMHITSKGADIQRPQHGFACHAHKDRDAPLAGDGTQRALGIWWPVGPVPKGPTFGYPGYSLDLRVPVGALFSTSHLHGSKTTRLPAGADVVGTSTELSQRDVLHCAKVAKTLSQEKVAETL